MLASVNSTKMWMVDMLKGRWEKNNGQKKNKGQRQVGGPEGGGMNLVLEWPAHEKTKLGR